VSGLFLEGIAAVVAGIVVFCGSIFLLLAMVLGARLAYFITATVSLAALLILGVVWSINPLGPVGKLPEWVPFAIGADPSSLDFAPAADYPDGPWRPIDTNDTAQAALGAELEGAAPDYMVQSTEAGKVDTFEDPSDALVNSDKTRLLQQGSTQYGAVTMEGTKPSQGEPTVIVMRYDPGNPLGPPRMIAAGTFVLFALHLFGLSRSERRARARSAGPVRA
jgi:hypothetical protein